VLGAEVAVDHAGVEICQGLDLGEELACLPHLGGVEERQREPFELGALLAIGGDPVDFRKDGGLDAMQGFQKRADALAVLVDEWTTCDEGVDDEWRIARDELELRHLNREYGRQLRQEGDLALESLDYLSAPRNPHDPAVVQEHDLEVEAVVDLDETHAAYSSEPSRCPARMTTSLEPTRSSSAVLRDLISAPDSWYSAPQYSRFVRADRRM
jgi:hypothetical protein